MQSFSMETNDGQAAFSRIVDLCPGRIAPMGACGRWRRSQDCLNRVMRWTSSEPNVADRGNFSEMQEREFGFEFSDGLAHGRGQAPMRILCLPLRRLEQAQHPLFLKLLDLAIQRAPG